MTRILRISSHTGYSRYLCAVKPAGRIARCPEIPSPYACGPDHVVYHDATRGKVIVVETSHKTYDVFRVPDDVTIYRTTTQLERSQKLAGCPLREAAEGRKG